MNDIYGRIGLDGTVKTIAVVDAQWGDTGKGKIVDFFAGWADVIIRGNGGANAGHTVFKDGRQFDFHLIPSGILYDSLGKLNVIGSGVAFNPYNACAELDQLKRCGFTYDGLCISHRAKLVLPQHVVADRVAEISRKSGKIGTTGRGIGPVYEDFVARRGLFVNDMLNSAVLSRKLEANIEYYARLLGHVDKAVLEKIMSTDEFRNGAYFNSRTIFDLDAIAADYCSYGDRLRDMVCDTEFLVRRIVGSKKVLLEGAQGLLLSVDSGTYPYVTSSDSSVMGLAKGAGMFESDIDLVLAVVKAFYMTRVGEGPFPTEIGGDASARLCCNGGGTRDSEKKSCELLSVNSRHELSQSIAIRIAGNEYGATTGRPRRIGWLDIPLLRYAVSHTGANVILTKVDVLDSCYTIRLCTNYKYTGMRYSVGSLEYDNGYILSEAPVDCDILKHCEPVYKNFSGWRKPISGVLEREQFPYELSRIIGALSELAGVNVVMVSVGPERSQIVPYGRIVKR